MGGEVDGTRHKAKEKWRTKSCFSGWDKMRLLLIGSPLVPTTSEAKKMITQAKEKGVFLQIGLYSEADSRLD